MTDLENKCEVNLERKPALTLDWGHFVLDRSILMNFLMAYSSLPHSQDGKEEEMIGRYLLGIAILGKNDIHLRMEGHALSAFYDAFRAALQYYGDWDGKISKYQLQSPPYPDLIRVMQRHSSRPSVRRVFRAAPRRSLTDG